MYCTDILRRIDRSNIYIDTHIVAMYLATICIALDIKVRVVSTVHIPRCDNRYWSIMYTVETVMKDIGRLIHVAASHEIY